MLLSRRHLEAVERLAASRTSRLDTKRQILPDPNTTTMFEIEQRLEGKGILRRDIVAAAMELYIPH
ncbi:MAG TPA: hypothetical protein PLB80_03715, partial [Methanoculleus sp.]|nr:hypothetical protein [Methanoculleus sp.]